jgi:hypothetical protein
VICKEVARHSNAPVLDIEPRPQKFEEVADELRIGIRYAGRVLVSLVALGPIEHDAGGMGRMATAREETAFGLVRAPTRARSLRVRAPRFELAIERGVTKLQLVSLTLGQLDVSDPRAHRRDRDTDDARNLLDRTRLFPPQPSGCLPLVRFHD